MFLPGWVSKRLVRFSELFDFVSQIGKDAVRSLVGEVGSMV
jgi:hypothetical protein